MNKDTWISGITAFLIAAGGALAVVLVGEAPPTMWQVLAAIVLGVVSGAKDVRSLMKLPPLVLIFGLLSFGVMGCVTEKRLEVGGAYAGTAELAARPELFVLDASFDLAYAALDATFKHEKANRALLWKISPNIKRGLDKIRGQAGIVKGDYALARKIYEDNPTPAGLNEMQTALNKLQVLNVAALNVVEKKGNL